MHGSVQIVVATPIAGKTRALTPQTYLNPKLAMLRVSGSLYIHGAILAATPVRFGF